MSSLSSFVSTARFPHGSHELIQRSARPSHVRGEPLFRASALHPSVCASQPATKLQQTQRAGNTPLGLLGGAGQGAGSLKSFPS